MTSSMESRIVHIIELIGLALFICIVAVVNYKIASDTGGALPFLTRYLSPAAGSMLILLGLLTILMRKLWVEGTFWIGVGYLIAGVGNGAIFGWETTPMFVVIGLIFLWAADLITLVRHQRGAVVG